MANHLRRQIREAFAAQVTGLAQTGSNVFQSRVYPLENADLPGLCVYTVQEQSEADTIQAHLMRELTIACEIYLEQSANADDLFDEIAQDVEEALADLTLGGLCKDLELKSTEINLADEGAKRYIIGTLSYNCLYRTPNATPDTLI